MGSTTTATRSSAARASSAANPRRALRRGARGRPPRRAGRPAAARRRAGSAPRRRRTAPYEPGSVGTSRTPARDEHAPALARLLAPVRVASASRRREAAASCDVEAVLHVRGAVSEHAEARAGLRPRATLAQRCERTPRLVLEREEHVVVRPPAPVAPRVDLRVDARVDRPEELHGLVDEVRCRGRGAGRRLSAAGVRSRQPSPVSGRQRSKRDSNRWTRPSSPSSSSFRTVRKSPSQRRFWSTVSIEPRSAAASTSARPSSAFSASGLSTTTGQPRLERGQPEREMALVRRRDHGQVELGRSLPDLIRGPDDLNSSVLPERLFAALFVTGHDHRQLEARRRRDERRMEDGAREPVAEQCHVRGHAWKAREALGLVVQLRADGLRQPTERLDLDAALLVPPRARHRTVDEERADRVSAPDRRRPSVGGTSGRDSQSATGVHEQCGVPGGEKAHWCGGVRVRQRRLPAGRTASVPASSRKGPGLHGGEPGVASQVDQEDPAHFAMSAGAAGPKAGQVATDQHRHAVFLVPAGPTQ